MIDEASKAIEDQINSSLVVQMKQVDETVRGNVARVNALDAQALI